MKNILLILSLVLVFACKKDKDPEPEQPQETYTAAFTFWGTGVGKSVKLQYILKDTNDVVHIKTWEKTFTYDSAYTFASPLYVFMELPGLNVKGLYYQRSIVTGTGLQASSEANGEVLVYIPTASDPQSWQGKKIVGGVNTIIEP